MDVELNFAIQIEDQMKVLDHLSKGDLVIARELSPLLEEIRLEMLSPPVETRRLQ